MVWLDVQNCRGWGFRRNTCNLNHQTKRTKESQARSFAATGSRGMRHFRETPARVQWVTSWDEWLSHLSVGNWTVSKAAVGLLLHKQGKLDVYMRDRIGQKLNASNYCWKPVGPWRGSHILSWVGLESYPGEILKVQPNTFSKTKMVSHVFASTGLLFQSV